MGGGGGGSTILDDRRRSSEPATHPPTQEHAPRQVAPQQLQHPQRRWVGSRALSLSLSPSSFSTLSPFITNTTSIAEGSLVGFSLSLSLASPFYIFSCSESRLPIPTHACKHARARSSFLSDCLSVCLCPRFSISPSVCVCECVRVRFPFIVGLCMHALLVLSSTAVPRKGESAPVSWRLGGGWSGGNWEQVGTTRAWWGRSRRRGGGAEAYRQWQRQRSPRMGWEAMSS